MKKKICLALLSLMTLSFSLTGCGDSKQSTEKNVEVSIDFDVASVSNGTFKMDYPKNDWLEMPTSNQVIKVNLVKSDADVQNGTNINVSRTMPIDSKYSIQEYAKEIPKTLEKQSFNTLKVNKSEIMNIGEKETLYLEMDFKITDEFIKNFIKESGMTEEDAEKLGIKETLSKTPATKQMQIHFLDTSDKDKKTVTSITGTYMQEDEKEEVLKAMQTMVQTATKE